MAIAKQVTFEGLKYNLDNEDRLAAEVAHQSAGQQVLVESTTGAATPTLTMADSGKTFLMTATGGVITYTLPAVSDAAGFHAKFVVVVASNDDINWTSAAANIIVSCTEYTAAGAAQVHLTHGGRTTLKMNADTVNSVVGDSVELFCNGTNFIAIGHSNTQSGTAFWVGS